MQGKRYPINDDSSTARCKNELLKLVAQTRPRIYGELQDFRPAAELRKATDGVKGLRRLPACMSGAQRDWNEKKMDDDVVGRLSHKPHCVCGHKQTLTTKGTLEGSN